MPVLRPSLLLLSAALFAHLPSASTEVEAEVDLVLLVDGLDSPVGITGANDGSGRLFIVEQAGVIKIWDGARILPTPFLDLRSVVDDTQPEQGLLGLAFHPDFADNGRFFINYTFDPAARRDRTRIAEYQVSAADSNVADPESARTILEVVQDFGNHNGGDLHFGPDGFLYIGMGDGGSGGDPRNRGQSLKRLLGKMLRIDIDSSWKLVTAVWRRTMASRPTIRTSLRRGRAATRSGPTVCATPGAGASIGLTGDLLHRRRRPKRPRGDQFSTRRVDRRRELRMGLSRGHCHSSRHL